MNALVWMKSTGVGVGLTPEGGLELDGLENLDDELYARVLEVARARKAEIVEELRADNLRTPQRARGEAVAGANVSHSGPIPADASPLEALARFEADPRGVVSWLAQQREGQSRHLSARWVALIQAEAKERMRNME